MFEHQHRGRGVHVADRGHLVFAPLVLDRFRGLLLRPSGRARIRRRFFAVPFSVRGLLQRLDQARPVRGLHHPQRPFAQILRTRETPG